MKSFYIRHRKFGIKRVIVDDEDFHFLIEMTWLIMQDKNTFYVKHDIHKGHKRQTIRLHRLILGAKEGEIVDHINGDGLNNCRSNLRIVSMKQNSQNRSIAKNNTTGYKGVYFRKNLNKYESRIRVDGKLKRIGLHESKVDAAIAYNEAALFNFGDYAKLNLIP